LPFLRVLCVSAVSAWVRPEFLLLALALRLRQFAVLNSVTFRESFMRHLCILIVLALLVSACGQKGPLYLPKDSDKTKKHEPRKTEEGTIEK
jgi:predicted small lipoprotein YifL